MNSKQEDLEGVIIQAIAEQTGVAPQKVGLRTRLGEDLGVDGDDAAELLQMISESFGVDFSGLHFDRHFGPEGLSIVRAIRDTVKPRRCYPLTVQDLVDAARSGVFTYDYDHRPFVRPRPWHVWIMFLALLAVVFAVIQLFK